MNVIKFGGTSLANADCFSRCREIVLANVKRKIIVVSAPGKRHKKDTKVTDLLYLATAYKDYGFDPAPVIDKVKARFYQIVNSLKLDVDIDKEFKTYLLEYSFNNSVDYLVSRGEFLTAKIFAKFLGTKFIDAKNIIVMDGAGKVDLEATSLNIDLLKTDSRCVIGGFYGTSRGQIKLMARGGGDDSGAYLARLLKSDVYEVFTDVSGLMRTNPKIVDNPHYVKSLTYFELKLLNELNASVISKNVAPILDGSGVKLIIKNTFKPKDRGTVVFDGEKPFNKVTAIGCEDGYVCISAKVIDGVEPALKSFENYLKGLGVVPIGTCADDRTISVILQQKKHLQKQEELLDCIKNDANICDFAVIKDLAVITVVGGMIEGVSNIYERLFKALSKIGVTPVAITKSAMVPKLCLYIDKKRAAETVKRLDKELFKGL